MSVNWQPAPHFRKPTPLVTPPGPVVNGDLLREVARVQHDKTLQAVRDLVDAIATTQVKTRDRFGYGSTENRSATDFRDDLIAALKRLREEGSEG